MSRRPDLIAIVFAFLAVFLSGWAVLGIVAYWPDPLTTLLGVGLLALVAWNVWQVLRG